jgi:hypothetical protein
MARAAVKPARRNRGGTPGVGRGNAGGEMTDHPIAEDEATIVDALAYVGELFREISEENGQPPRGTQNQVVDFIRADPELSRYVRRWAAGQHDDDPLPRPPQRLPQDACYERVAQRLKAALLEEPVFVRGPLP